MSRPVKLDVGHMSTFDNKKKQMTELQESRLRVYQLSDFGLERRLTRLTCTNIHA